MRDDTPFDDDPRVKEVPELGSSFLSEERLSPEETATIDRALRAAVRRPGRERSRGWLIATVAAAALVTLVLLARPADGPGPDSIAVPADTPTITRTMSLEIVRSDLPDAKPYRMRVELELAPGAH